jgi:hypothetical protein
MELVDPVGVVKTKDAPMVDSGQVGQEEGEIVSNDLLFCVDPDLFTQNPDSACSPKMSFVIGDLAQAGVSAQNEILTQVMRITQHLNAPIE